ncbi:MAG: GNAT family N-acetyltransferase [Lachnospiraceae bacterium]
MLRSVWYKIEENKTTRSERVFLALQKKGIPCRKGVWFSEKLQEMEHILVLTDDRELAEQISKLGIACVGVAGESDAFFNGTDLVVEEPEKLELQELEKYLQRYHGLPVTIARTRRLTLREMIVDDWRVLSRIDHQSGMEKARKDAEETDSFEKSRLESYIGSQYRLYGYGLWSVVLDKERTDSEEKERCEAVGSEKIFFAKDGTADVAAGKTGGRAEIVTDITAGKTGGRVEIVTDITAGETGRRVEIVTDITAGETGGRAEIVTDITAGETGGQTERIRECVIGCCGFSALEERPDMQKSIEDGEDAQDQENPVILELQYMLDEAYRRQGYGTEMCRAAIAYAYEQLEADEIMVRVRSDYQEAISFARSIGFRPVSVKPENRAEDKQENRPEDKKERQEVLWMRHEREQAAPE